MTTLEGHPEFSEADRNAMRAYIQRCEVRLSTLHRVATAFISGAGLLLLIPVFFKDAVDNLLAVLLGQASNQFASLGGTGWLLTLALFGCLAYLLLLSLVIPVYGVYLLLKDIIHFYFTIYTPGFSENLYNPTFALTGLLFPIDESPAVKHEVMRREYQATRAGFMIPFSKERSELYFDTIINRTNGHIIPESRDLEKLKRLNVLPENYDEMTVKRFNAALGVARSLDRTLVEEVAMTEMSLARHVLYLRRLMLRYVKTLLMFLWTAIISFMMLPLLKDTHFPPLLILSVGYLVWALTVMRVMTWPIYWIYRHLRDDSAINHVDPQLLLMQITLKRYCYVAVAAGVVAVILSAAAFIIR